MVVLDFLLGISFFFFQAEDGIRDPLVTGVQTCALPIFSYSGRSQDAIPEVYPGAAPTAQLEHSPGFATNCLPEWPGACQKQPGSSGEVRFAAIQAQVHASCRFDGRASAVTPRNFLCPAS